MFNGYFEITQNSLRPKEAYAPLRIQCYRSIGSCQADALLFTVKFATDIFLTQVIKIKINVVHIKSRKASSYLICQRYF